MKSVLINSFQEFANLIVYKNFEGIFEYLFTTITLIGRFTSFCISIVLLVLGLIFILALVGILIFFCILSVLWILFIITHYVRIVIITGYDVCRRVIFIFSILYDAQLGLNIRDKCWYLLVVVVSSTSFITASQLFGALFILSLSFIVELRHGYNLGLGLCGPVDLNKIHPIDIFYSLVLCLLICFPPTLVLARYCAKFL